MSSGILRKYAPDDVAVTVGTRLVTGVHEGSFVEVERDVETSTLDIGSDGEATLTISPNQAGKVKITLQQSSPLNDYFSSLWAAIQQKDTTTGVQPIRVKDSNGTTVCSGLQSIPQKPAKVSFADKPEGREWTFIVPYLDITVGGESSV